MMATLRMSGRVISVIGCVGPFRLPALRGGAGHNETPSGFGVVRQPARAWPCCGRSARAILHDQCSTSAYSRAARGYAALVDSSDGASLADELYRLPSPWGKDRFANGK